MMSTEKALVVGERLMRRVPEFDGRREVRLVEFGTTLSGRNGKQSEYIGRYSRADLQTYLANMYGGTTTLVRIDFLDGSGWVVFVNTAWEPGDVSW